jgi:hypothetical protein
MRVTTNLQPEGHAYVICLQKPPISWATRLTRSLTCQTTKITRRIDFLKYLGRSCETLRLSESTSNTARCGKSREQKVLMRLVLPLRLGSKVARTHLTHLHILSTVHRARLSAGTRSKYLLLFTNITELEVVEISALFWKPKPILCAQWIHAIATHAPPATSQTTTMPSQTESFFRNVEVGRH